MTRYGYHVSHEQHAPSALLQYVQLAEEAGFDGAMSSDHFHPWLEENGHSGFGFSWLGAALQATKRTVFGCVCAPGDRYHPAIVAQASATLAEMFPDRFWIAVGSGEALNEHVTGNRWPPKRIRQDRLLECIEVIRALWAGETVSHWGHSTVIDAKLYTRPKDPPLLIGAAVSEATAKWMGQRADGLVTTGRPKAAMKKMIEAFHEGGGEGKPIFVQHPLCWARDEREAKRAAHEQWRFAALEPDRLWDLRTPAEFAAATADVTPEQVAERIRVSSDLEQHAAWLHEYAELGIDRVVCFNVAGNQREFIETFGAKVLPGLQG